MYRTDFWTLWEKAKVGCFKRTASKRVYYLGWHRSPAQVGCMRQVLGPGALGRPRGIGWSHLNQPSGTCEQPRASCPSVSLTISLQIKQICVECSASPWHYHCFCALSVSLSLSPPSSWVPASSQHPPTPAQETSRANSAVPRERCLLKSQDTCCFLARHSFGFILWGGKL